METANAFDLNLLWYAGKIPSDILKNFPFWISSTEMDTDPDFWPEGEAPEGEELVGDERWVQFPENFSRQRLLFGEYGDEFEIWTPDLIELSQKHNGILFVIKGDEIEQGWFEEPHPGVFVHLRFKSELDRMAAIRDIRKNISEQIDSKISTLTETPTDFPIARNIDIRKLRERQENPALFSEFFEQGQYPEAYFERDRTYENPSTH
jgi:hypothetical protein